MLFINHSENVHYLAGWCLATFYMHSTCTYLSIIYSMLMPNDR